MTFFFGRGKKYKKVDGEALTQFSLKSTRSNSESKTLSVQIFKGCVLWVTLENRCCSYTKSKQIRACLSLLEQVHYWESWLRENRIFSWTLHLEHIEFYREITFRSMINIWLHFVLLLHDFLGVLLFVPPNYIFGYFWIVGFLLCN